MDRRMSHAAGFRGRLALFVLALLAATAVAAVVGCGFGTHQVSAERFVLKDAKGRTRAVLGTADGDDPALTLYDRDGVSRAELALAAGGWPQLVLHRTQDRPDGIELIVAPDRTEVVMEDAKGRSFLSSKAQGRALSLADKKGNFLAGIVIGDGADPVLELYNREGKLLFRAPGKK